MAPIFCAWKYAPCVGSYHTCKSQPGHFYTIARQAEGINFVKPNVFPPGGYPPDTFCRLHGNRVVGKLPGSPIRMPWDCIPGFQRYMADYGISQSEILNSVANLHTQPDAPWLSDSYVICRRKYAAHVRGLTSQACGLVRFLPFS